MQVKKNHNTPVIKKTVLNYIVLSVTVVNVGNN